MSETHINAYFADVEEKKQLVFAAQAEYQAAQDRLEAKKKATNWVEEVPSTETKSSEIVEEPKKTFGFPDKKK